MSKKPDLRQADAEHPKPPPRVNELKVPLATVPAVQRRRRAMVALARTQQERKLLELTMEIGFLQTTYLIARLRQQLIPW